jgi:hypothetical protein
MKRLITCFVFIIMMAVYGANAQNIQVSMSPKPSPYLSDWETHTETLVLIVNNTSGKSVDVKVKTQLFNGNDVVIAETDQPKMPVLTIPPGISSYHAEDIYPINDLKYDNSYKTKLLKTGRLPDDNYRLCVSLTDPITGAPFTAQQPQCKTFTITAYQAPILLSPKDKDTITIAQTEGFLFKWTPVVPSPREPAIYHLQVWEILPGQDAMRAFLGNKPIVEKDIRAMTQAPWPPEFELPQPGMRYVWSVQAFDKDGRPIVDNGGRAEPFSFTVEDADDNNPTRHHSSQRSVNVTDTSHGTAAANDTIFAGQNGEFKIVVKHDTVEADGSLTGTGKVYINWLMTNVAVEFKKIKINTGKRLYSGGIVTTQSDSTGSSFTTYPKAWAMSLLSGPGVANVVDHSMNWTNNTINHVISWVNTVAPGSQPLINYQSNIAPPPIPDNSLKMPFGLQFNSGQQKLVITEMVFEKDTSKINFLAQDSFVKSGNPYTLGFAGKYFLVHPGSIDFSTGRVELVADVTIPNLTSDPKMTYTFKKGTDTSGCYIAWDNSGITDFGMALDVSFSRDWLIPIPSATTSSQAVATLQGTGTSMKDILLTGNIPACEIVGTSGLKIQNSHITLDLSDTRNPDGIAFPANYPTSPDVTWQGLYIDTFGITLPETWKTGTSPTQITARHLIIDDQGLTTSINATNVITFSSCTVANLSASLDTIDITILNSSLESGNAVGTLVLPISESTPSNTLKYTATFSQASGDHNFQIVIVPTQPIDASVLKGSMTLDPTSNITASVKPDTMTVSIILNGDFNWNRPDLSTAQSISTGSSAPTRPGGINGVKMELAFENVALSYIHIKTPETNTLTFNPGTWSFASPQKLLANFPVSIKKIYYKSLTTVNPNTAGVKELLRGALMMDIVANLTDDIGGSTTVGAAFSVEFNTNTIKFTPAFKGVFIEKIEVHADLSAVKIDGSLDMYDNDPTYGDGFKAQLNVTFTAVSLSMSALVQFGNTTYLNNNQFYRYWRAEADVMFSPGIPFLTGVAFYGFGGGAFYNMESHTAPANPPNTGYKFTFTPKKSSLGFMVNATIGTTPKVETFNADVSLLAQFSHSNGIELIAFHGNFWLAAKIADRPAAKIKGGVAVSYNFPDKIFNMVANLWIHVTEGSTNVITTPDSINLVMNIDGRANKWYFKCGTPTQPNTVDVFGLNLYSYFMIGNDLGTPGADVPNGFTPKFTSNYYNAIGSYPSMGNVGTGGVGANTSTGKGIATGVGISFSKQYNDNLFHGVCRDWAIAANLDVGAEINIAFLDQTGCAGINGYRASGDVGLYFDVSTTVSGTHYRWPHVPGCGDVSSNLFTIKLGAWAGGEFPNTTYLYGAVDGTVGLFDDLASIHFSKSFTYGTSCTGTNVATNNAAQEDQADSFKNKLIKYIAPSTTFNFPVSTPLSVKYALVPGEVFDVSENEGDGTTKNRTFKLEVTKTLEVNENGTWVTKTVQTKVNNTGEYMYYINGPVTINHLTSGQKKISQGNQNTTMNTSGNHITTQSGHLTISHMGPHLMPDPEPDYPNPVPDPENHLDLNKDYRFTVTATLKELTNGTWSTAKTRTGADVKETRIKNFKTGPQTVTEINKKLPLKKK